MNTKFTDISKSKIVCLICHEEYFVAKLISKNFDLNASDFANLTDEDKIQKCDEYRPCRKLH